MYICLCKAVSSTTIRRAIERGARTVEEVGDACEAGTACGMCQETIEVMLGEQDRVGAHAGSGSRRLQWPKRG